jgi:hypothetical protein
MGRHDRYGSNPVFRVFRLQVRLGAESGIPNGQDDVANVPNSEVAGSFPGS